MPQTQKKINHSDLINLYRKALNSGLSLDKIEKKVDKLLDRSEVTHQVETKDDLSRLERLKNRLPLIVRVGAFALPAIFIVIGFLMVGSAVFPIVGFYLKTLPEMNAKRLAAPIPQSDVLDVTPLIIADASTGDNEQVLGEVLATDLNDGPIIIDADLDYTNLSNWFDEASLEDFKQISQFEGKSDEYVLDIPKLKIENALVKVGGTDLNKSLIQYPGTALPGKQGSPVIFGHSVLRQFYNPKQSNPRRYTSVFSTIMTLTKGDKIYITHGNIKYSYVVQSKTEVKPTDTYILAQRYDSRQLKLVTCVPEGTYLRRGIVTAALVKE
ncbi:MAG: sortase [Candidatus Woesebacteria bacterium]|jgi:sortase A